MKAKITQEMCYLAGIQSKWDGEKNSIGIRTKSKELEEKFVEIALKLGVGPEQLRVQETEDTYTVFFYHSRIAKALGRIVERKTKMFRVQNEFVSSYLAGMFDACGRVAKQGVYMRLDSSDELLLELFGVHTSQGHVLNLSRFFTLTKGHSVLLSGIR